MDPDKLAWPQRIWKERDSVRMPSLHDGSAVVYFDGVCCLCNGLVDWLMLLDRRRRIQYSPLQSARALRLLPRELTDLAGTEASFVVQIDGQIFLRSQAFIEVFIRMGGVYRLAALLKGIPSPWLDTLYRIVARNRFRWFGKRAECRLPSTSEKRFLLD